MQAKNNVLNKMIGLIPGAGSVVQSVTGTVLGSSLVIKNALGAAGIVFLFLFLLLPLTKLLCYVFFYFLLSVVLEPVADERFVECISAAVKCGLLLIKVLCMSSGFIYCDYRTYHTYHKSYRIKHCENIKDHK